MRTDVDHLWVFDLDNTLHDATPHIFPHINRAMTAYICRHVGLDDSAAGALRQEYWHRYGATLLGLMRHHRTDPRHFLWHTHQFPELGRMMVFERTLKTTLRRLRGRKVVFSNAPRHYVEAVLAQLGTTRLFDTIYAIENVRFRPKPQVAGFLRVLAAENTPAARAVMVDDSAENLATARRLGMRTVWVGNPARRPPWVDVAVRSIRHLPRAVGQL